MRVRPQVGSNDRVPVCREVVDDLLANFRVGLDADEFGTEVFDIESRQRSGLGKLNIHR